MFPLIAYAADGQKIALLEKIKVMILNPVIGLLFALALAYFLWGVAKYIQNAENDKERDEGKEHIEWGLIGMFIMVSVYGIINVICATIPGAC